MTRSDKWKVTRRALDPTTLRDVEDGWQRYSDGEMWERIQWARLNMTEFSQAADAAKSLGIKPGTYRTYERPREANGREPPLGEIVRIAKRYRVSWIWLARGQGHAINGVASDDRLQLISDKASQLPAERRDDALNAALSVIESFARKAS